MHQRGITLVELMIVVALGMVIGLIIMNMYITSNRTYMDQNRILDAQRSGRLTIETMARTLREAGLDPLGTANAGIEVADASEVRITRDLNMDGDVDDSGERVTFKLVGNVLRRGEGAVGAESWQDVAANVAAFSLEYWDETPTQIATPVAAGSLANIRQMIVTLTFQEDKAAGGDFERTYSTGVSCRNLFR